MNKFKAAAIEVLSKAQKALHGKEITKIALQEGILETDGATPEQSMIATLSVDIKNNGINSEFIRVSASTFKLNPKKKRTVSASAQIEEDKELDERIIVDSSFTGKAGEHLICSELLFRGYNASIMSVDVGMDIAATKDNKLFSIQVKTANINSYNTYNFDVRQVSFQRHQSGNVFYIFVLKGKNKTDFLILPYYEMERKVKEGGITETAKKTKYRVSISVRDAKIFLGNRNHEMSYFLNEWDIIK